MNVRSDMENELFNLWSRPIGDLPVFKDLPRLAGRITVEGQFSKAPSKRYSVYESKKEVTIREFLCDLAKNLHQDPKTVEPFIVVLENNWYFHVDQSILLIPDEKWREYNIPDRVSLLLKQRAEQTKNQNDDREKKIASLTRDLSQFKLDKLSIESGDHISNTDKLEEIEEEKGGEEKKSGRYE